jgi:hypothetical protein
MKEKVLVIDDLLPEQLEEKINLELASGWKIKDKSLFTVSGLYIPGYIYRGVITFEKKI